jgi:hypothetical protein
MKKYTEYNYKSIDGLYPYEHMLTFIKLTPVRGLYYEYPDKNQECTHDFATYIGFTESFEYCRKCDHKRTLL